MVMGYSNSVPDDINELDHALNGRDEVEPTIFCGDYNLERYYFYKSPGGGKPTRSRTAPGEKRGPGEKIKKIEDLDYFQYWGGY